MRVAPARARPLGPGALVALASGLILACAFPSLDLGPLALVALVPLLWLWRDAGPARAALYGWIAGVGFFAIVLMWAWYFGAIAYAPLVMIEAAYWAGAGAVVGALGRRGVRSPWITAATWVAFEVLRDRWPLGGLAWAEIGTAFHNVTVARALLAVGGVPLLSFLVVAANGLIVDVIVAGRTRAKVPEARRRRLRSTAAALVGIVLIGAVGLAATGLRMTPRASGRLHFALLQGNDQDRYLTQAEIDSEYLTRAHLRLAATLKGPYDLIVFPESALDTDPEADPVLRARLGALGRRHDAYVLINTIATADDGTERNVNRLYAPDGHLVGTYVKQHLVPFGEYVPFRAELGWISGLKRVPEDYQPGHSTRVLDVRGVKVGTLICFDSAYAPLVRNAVRDGAQLIVVQTNNRSYRRSANSVQHVALAQVRAAETGRPVLQASISGITAVIDASGNVVSHTHLFRNAVVTGDVTATAGETLYVRYGDWVFWPLGLLLAGAAITAGSRARRARRLGEEDDRTPPGSRREPSGTGAKS